jgi:uncharacterized protein with FMN-binding domain
MKKYIIAGVLVIAFVAYLVFTNKSQTPVATAPGTPTTTPPSGNPPSNSPSATAGQYKDGTYTGAVADAFYGNLQATVTIQGGMITDVTFPHAPSNGHSGEVSAQALPILKQEAITAQSANVNIVSGATQDSQAFQQSLASALAQAKV